MNALILDGATGTRMTPITDWIPKDLIRIDGISLFQRHIEALQRTQEIEKVAIKLYQHKDKMLKAIKSLEKLDMPLIPYVEKELRGTAEGTLNIWESLGKEEPLMVIYGDTYFFNTELFKCLALYSHQPNIKSVLGVGAKKYIPWEAKGMASLQGDLVKEFKEHPEIPVKLDKYFQNAGVILLHPETFPLLKKLKIEGEYDLGEHFLPEAVKKYSFDAYDVGDYVDIGDLASYCQLQSKIYRQKLEKCLETSFLELFKIILETEGTIWIIGNGGSLAIAKHAALDLTKAAEKRAFAVGDIEIITAYSNDIAFGSWIAYYLNGLWKGKKRKNDILIALSTSGKSSNILSAVKLAKKYEILSYAMTSKGSTLTKEADQALEFDEKDPKILEDIFGIVLHQIVKMLEEINDNHPDTSKD